MKKLQLSILIIVIIGLLAFGDYFVNLPNGIPAPKPSLPSATQQGEEKAPDVVNHPNITKLILDRQGGAQSYQIEKRTRSTELFEKFDFSDSDKLSIYKNILIYNESGSGKLPIYIYEIHGPGGQGGVSYLNVKLSIIDQLGSASGINETGDIGFSSLFYNDVEDPNTGFMLSQVADITFGFKYSKDQPEAFDFVKNLVNTYMSLISNNT